MRNYRRHPKNEERQRNYMRGYRRAYLERPGVKERQRDYFRDYFRERYQTNLDFRLAQKLRARIRNALKGASKSTHTFDLLGCSLDELRAHIETLFKTGMTWENYGAGGWHLDHIKPCASFDLTDPEQQRICFHYTNLQPLWAGENLRKGAKH